MEIINKLIMNETQFIAGFYEKNSLALNFYEFVPIILGVV